MRGKYYLLCLVCAASGTLAGRYAPTWAVIGLVLLAAGCTGVLALVRIRAARFLLLPLMALSAWSLMSFAQFHSITTGLLPRLARAGGAVTVSGRVVSPLNVSGETSSFFLKLSALSTERGSCGCGERVFMTVRGVLPERDYFPGVRLQARGRLRPPGGNASWLLDRGSAASMSVNPGALELSREPPDPVSRFVHAARSWVSRKYALLFDPRTAGLMEGVTLSKLDRLDAGVQSDLRSCGLSHIIAVSGLHVGSSAMLVLALCTALRMGRRSRYTLAALSACMVLAVANFRPSATRATLMASAGFGGALAGRRYDGLAGFSIAGLAILGLNPRALFDTGFQYSFAAAGGIILASGRGRRAPGGGGANVAPSGTRAFLSACAGAQLGIIPLMLARGEGVPVTAIVANLLVVPLIGPLLLSGWAAAGLSVLGAAVARPLAALPGAAAGYILFVSNTLAVVPRAGPFGSTARLLSLLFYCGGLILTLRAAGRGRNLLAPALCVGLALALALLSCAPVARFGARDAVTFLDVGEGDAVLARDSSGACVLVDGGPDPRKLVEKLEARGVRKIDLMVSTHPHSDHMAGLVEALGRLPVGSLLEPGLPRTSAMYRRLIELAGSRAVRRTTAREGQVLRVSDRMELEVVRAPADLDHLPEDVNDCSLVLVLTLREMRVLLCADAGAEAQQEMISRHPGLGCDVLKVPHQGASEAAGEELLAACRPALAAISVGRGNRYGHPSARCLDLLSARGVRVARTDRDGDIEVSVSNGRIGLATGGR